MMANSGIWCLDFAHWVFSSVCVTKNSADEIQPAMIHNDQRQWLIRGPARVHLQGVYGNAKYGIIPVTVQWCHGEIYYSAGV